MVWLPIDNQRWVDRCSIRVRVPFIIIEQLIVRLEVVSNRERIRDARLYFYRVDSNRLHDPFGTFLTYSVLLLVALVTHTVEIGEENMLVVPVLVLLLEIYALFSEALGEYLLWPKSFILRADQAELPS